MAQTWCIMGQAWWHQAMERGKSQRWAKTQSLGLKVDCGAWLDLERPTTSPGRIPPGSIIPGIFLEAVDTGASPLDHPGTGNPGNDHHLMVRLESSKIAASPHLGDLDWGTVLRKWPEQNHVAYSRLTRWNETSRWATLSPPGQTIMITDGWQETEAQSSGWGWSWLRGTESETIELPRRSGMRELEFSDNFIRNPPVLTQVGSTASFPVPGDCDKAGDGIGRISWHADSFASASFDGRAGITVQEENTLGKY